MDQSLLQQYYNDFMNRTLDDSIQLAVQLCVYYMPLSSAHLVCIVYAGLQSQVLLSAGSSLEGGSILM